ncbi:MAG: hypothetical protein HYW27_01835 [Candidatus Aenigmarchaeota archaeon]|nr:hypothetical protein [Candidatus Aenigmarchaeota archaeon]
MDAGDVNHRAYLSALISGSLEPYRGRFVAFVGGTFVGHCSDRNRFLEALRRDYRNRPVYVTLCGDDTVYDVPSVFEHV